MFRLLLKFRWKHIKTFLFRCSPLYKISWTSFQWKKLDLLFSTLRQYTTLAVGFTCTSISFTKMCKNHICLPLKAAISKVCRIWSQDWCILTPNAMPNNSVEVCFSCFCFHNRDWKRTFSTSKKDKHETCSVIALLWWVCSNKFEARMILILDINEATCNKIC